MRASLRALWPVALGLSLLLACAHGPRKAETFEPPPCPFADAKDGTQSYELLCREPVANQVKVKHILIGWDELATPDHPRPVSRTYAEAQQLARDLLKSLRSGTPIEPLMAKYSEDPGSAASGQAYDVSPSAELVWPFKALSLRLNPGEAGIVKSNFGLHVIQRVK